MHYLDILFVIIGDCILQIPPPMCFFDQMLWLLIFSLFVLVRLLIEGSYYSRAVFTPLGSQLIATTAK